MEACTPRRGWWAPAIVTKSEKLNDGFSDYFPAAQRYTVRAPVRCSTTRLTKNRVGL
ncbi:hypothetical protein DENIT_200017 [Pseudomonas veronii]|nr:hypothetical protein DENIT_200017 [Pseudomonas veronii]